MKPIGVLDFETAAIMPRPAYPPKPVGVALRSIRWKKGKYLAWGHPKGMGNNCSRSDAVREIKQFTKDHLLVCHHAGFDLDVGETHLGLSWPTYHHDTLIQSFLIDPDSDSMSLKPLAARYLDMPPEEQDLLHDWIMANIEGATKKTAGMHIALAPVHLVGPYAIGDVDRTLLLHQKFYGEIAAEPRFLKAYDREIKVTRTLIKMERRGIPIPVDKLAKDLPATRKVLTGIEATLLKKLKVPAKFHSDILNAYDAQEHFKWAGKGFGEQLVRSKLVKELPLTEKGNPSVSAESLIQVMPKKLAHEFEVRSQIATCINTFMLPWLKQSQANNGLFYARFNQVRNGDEWGKKTGARTGRLSMTPNLQNVIRSDKDARVPQLRIYIAILKSLYQTIGQRDYSQQELRLLADFENGPFLQSFLEHPDQDAHMLVRDLIESTTGLVLERRPVKDLNFGLIYGQGLALTAEKMGVSREDAKRFRAAHGAALPGVPILQAALKEAVRSNEPIWTWGGRRYYCEKPIYFKGRWLTFEYKMLNKKIQGSAADVTKEGMVNYDSLGEIAEENPMFLQVHDELLVGIKNKRRAKQVHCALRDAMADVEGIQVPMLTDGKLGPVWGTMEKVAW
jgi:DNA polymerase-1